MLKKTLILLAVSLAFAACTTEPENKNAKPGEAITATPAPSATQAPTATPSPATTTAVVVGFPKSWLPRLSIAFHDESLISRT